MHHPLPPTWCPLHTLAPTCLYPLRKHSVGFTPRKVRFWWPRPLPEPQGGKNTHERTAQRGLWTITPACCFPPFPRISQGGDLEGPTTGSRGAAFWKEPCGEVAKPSCEAPWYLLPRQSMCGVGLSGFLRPHFLSLHSSGRANGLLPLRPCPIAHSRHPTKQACSLFHMTALQIFEDSSLSLLSLHFS